MPVTPVQFACNIFWLNGMPLKLPESSMRHIYPIYNNKSNISLFKFGRQTHKSTTLGYKITLPCIKYPNYHSLYVAPTGNQVSVFSSDKLDGAISGSEVISGHYTGPKEKDQITYKEFTNGSRIYLRSAYHTADSIRGISADMTTIDEVQDIVSDNIPVIEQCMSHSLAKWESMREIIPTLPMHLFNSKVYAGTPKTLDNTLEKYWEKSSQNEFIIKCTHCNKWNYINEYNIGPECLVCNKCERPIYYDDGQWISMNSGAFIDGYRLPQIVLKWINNPDNPEAWQQNVIQTQAIYSTEKYYNEVLALAYANARNPLNYAEMKAACGEHNIIDPDKAHLDKEISGMPMFAGIDWGKGDLLSGTSYSILVIGGYIKGKFRVVFIKKYVGKHADPLFQVQDMLGIISKFKAQLVLADTGDGRTSNALMVEKLTAQRFAEVYEHGTTKKKIRWDKDKGIYIMNRTQMMTDRFMEIKRGAICFPTWEEMQPYVSDFTSIYAEYSEQTRLTRYDHTAPDDVFHAYMFAKIAAMIGRGELSKYLVGGGVLDEEPTSYVIG
jgi:hypothetical protein